jgi:hypothetical protein
VKLSVTHVNVQLLVPVLQIVDYALAMVGALMATNVVGTISIRSAVACPGNLCKGDNLFTRFALRT